MRWLVAAGCAALCVACGSVEGPLLRELAPSDAAAPSNSGASELPITQNMSWQYQLSGQPDLELDVQLFVIDLFGTDADDLARLHAQGKVAVAYMSAGTRESFRSDADDFPERVVGNTHAQYPEEAWLDVRDDAVRAVMAVRMDLARSKGFDGLVPTSLSGYLTDTGFDLSAADQRAYSAWLSTEAHARGLYIAMTDDYEQVDQLVDLYDWAVHYSCIERGECADLTPFKERGKPVFDVETEGDSAEICAAGAALGVNVLMKRPQFDGYRVGCL